jgi:hypothetical protein
VVSPVSKPPFKKSANAGVENNKIAAAIKIKDFLITFTSFSMIRQE